ncbi:unnamed protein product [Soboliphyme baturini]|uniref:PNPLA domain-containing protein n=1 Tax=Soboliphyme baturini TaxID=241478 RepID=A0A183J246_9BILA|nr:unnamed protein product [Soboliphyme baturini]
MNLSFSGCGFLGIYHIGVAAAIKEYAPDLVTGKIAGASAGALAACSLVCGCCLGEAISGVLKITKEARSRSLGPLHPSFDLVRYFRSGLRNILPENAHRLASGRLFISLTRFQDGENVRVSEFSSKEELIDAVVCSSFVPFYSGAFPPVFRGTSYVDGGLSDNFPFSGESDICPQDLDSMSPFLFCMKNTSIRFTCQNFFRLSVSLFPPSLDVMNDMCRQGFEDGLRYLSKHNLISCARCITIRSTVMLSSEESVFVFSDDGSSTKLSTHRIVPKSISTVHRNSHVNWEEHCEWCRETASDAPSKGLPNIIKESTVFLT